MDYPFLGDGFDFIAGIECFMPDSAGSFEVDLELSEIVRVPALGPMGLLVLVALMSHVGMRNARLRAS
jgi:hypothetical protein